MKNEQALNLMVQLFGSAHLDKGKIDENVSADANISVTDSDGALLFTASTIHILWALQGSGILPEYAA